MTNEITSPIPCPYCGCEMRVEASYTYLGLWFRVVPAENHGEWCFLRGVQHRRFGSEESAIASWNRRADAETIQRQQKRIAELERQLEAFVVVDWWTDEHGDTHAIAANGQEVCHYVRGEHAKAVNRALAELDALIRDMWKCLSAHIESAINDGGIGYDYKPQERGCGESCTVNGDDCSMSLIELRMRELGIEVDDEG